MTLATTPLTRNVTRVFRSADADALAAGLDWYADAHRVADALAARYDVSLDVSAGIIAALSPMQSWGANINLAGRFLAAGGLSEGYLSLGLNKAARILAGQDVLHVLKSDKVSNFYRCIVAAGQTDAVCIDRHALDIAVNRRQNDATRGKLTTRQYATVADTYRAAGRVLGLAPAVVQAVSWVVWRRRYWSVGAFDGERA